MQVYGQLQNAALEVLSSNPASTVQGRVWLNSTSTKIILDDGTNKRALLRNDQNCVFGSSGTAASNIRLNRAAASVLQLVTGDDTTAEGSLSASLAQLSARQENYTTVGRPAAGNIGRLYFDTTLNILLADNGSAWNSVGINNPMTTGGDIIYGGASGVPTRLANGSAGQVLTSNGTTVAPSWAAATSVGTYNFTSQTSTYAAAVNDYVLCSSASFTVTLPTAVGQGGKTIVIQHNGTNFSQVYTLNTTSAQTIGGIASGSYALYTTGEILSLVSDGANWQIVDHRTETAWVDAGANTPTATSAYIFTISSSSVTAGAVYSNNGQNFYVTLTIASSVTLTCSGSGAPGASGTLTKVSGTGPSTIAFSSVASSVPTIGTATVVSNHFWWRRRGQGMECRLDLALSAAGNSSNGTGDYLWWVLGAFNANLTIDTTVLTANQNAGWSSGKPTQITGLVGNGWATATTNSPSGALGVMVYDSTKLRMAVIDMASNFTSGNACGVSSGHLGFTQLPHLSTSFTLPITGWQP